MPTLNDTFLVRGPLHLYNISVGRLLHKQTPEQIAWEATQEAGEQTEPADETEAALQSAIPANANGESRKRKARARAS